MGQGARDTRGPTPPALYLTNIARDNLNPVIFSLVVNDFILKNQTFNYAGQDYLKDRGVAFENQLNRNTAGLLDKPLMAYRADEFEANIPMNPVPSMLPVPQSLLHFIDSNVLTCFACFFCLLDLRVSIFSEESNF